MTEFYTGVWLLSSIVQCEVISFLCLSYDRSIVNVTSFLVVNCCCAFDSASVFSRLRMKRKKNITWQCSIALISGRLYHRKSQMMLQFMSSTFDLCKGCLWTVVNIHLHKCITRESIMAPRVCNPGLTEPENPGNPDFFQTRNPGLNGLPNPGFRV